MAKNKAPQNPFEAFIATLDMTFEGDMPMIVPDDPKLPDKAKMDRWAKKQATNMIAMLHNKNRLTYNDDIEKPWEDEFDNLAYVQVTEMSRYLGEMLRKNFAGKKVAWEVIAQFCVAYTWLAINYYNQLLNDPEFPRLKFEDFENDDDKNAPVS